MGKAFRQKTPLASAIRCGATRVTWLGGYLDHSLPEIDNNTVARSIPGICLYGQIASQSPVGNDLPQKLHVRRLRARRQLRSHSLCPSGDDQDQQRQYTGWLTWILERITGREANRVKGLMPRNYQARRGAYPQFSDPF